MASDGDGIENTPRMLFDFDILVQVTYAFRTGADTHSMRSRSDRAGGEGEYADR